MKNDMQNHRSLVFWIIAFGLLLRIGLMTFRFEEFNEDRDAYLGIAESLLQGKGYSSPGSDSPTAFRPPLYPVLLAGVIGIAGKFGIAFLHLLAAGAGIWATIRLAQQLGLKSGAFIAGLVVAIDPLLLRYSTLAMTETVFTALTTLLLVLWSYLQTSSSKNKVLLTGLCYGVACLCRPSLLPMIAVFFVLLLLVQWISERSFNGFLKTSFPFVIVGGIALLVLLPWGVRNQVQIGAFKLTTTHGGYTVLLGNNPVFYEAVVKQPIGTTWGDYSSEDLMSQTTWVNNLNQQLTEQGFETEVERDEAQYKMAYNNIVAEPFSFLRACLLRELRFWSPIPLGPQAKSISLPVYWGTALFYLGLYCCALFGAYSLWKGSATGIKLWLPAIALIITFSTVHAIYWSNARMRAPLIPVVALFAGLGIEKKLLRRIQESSSIPNSDD